MAWLELEPSGQYHVAFRFGNRKFKRSLKTSERKKAQAQCTRLEENISLVESGRLTIPIGVNIPTFLLSDGKLNGENHAPRQWTLGALCEEYLGSLPSGSMESNSIYTAKIHMNHFRQILGSRFYIQGLSIADLQRYVQRRSKQTGRRGNSVSPVTIKKELSTLSSVWSWARRLNYVTGPFPNDGLRFPKTHEKPPFQTWEEIEHVASRDGLTEAAVAELWDSLFLGC